MFTRKEYDQLLVLNSTKTPDDVVTTMTSLNTTKGACVDSCGLNVDSWCVGKVLLHLCPFCHRTRNSSEVFICIGQHWSTVVNWCDIKLCKSQMLCRFAPPTCHVDVRRGLPTIIHSSGHLCCEFGAVDVELQDLHRGISASLAVHLCFPLSSTFYVISLKHPKCRSACLNKLFSSAASSWSFTERSEKRTWQGWGDACLTQCVGVSENGV